MTSGSGPYLVGNNSPCGEDGSPGENAGNINIKNEITIFAYGGSGGSGGISPLEDNYTNSGGGAVGYPAARIGGGGAGGGGGEHAKAAGGYSGGAYEPYGLGNVNGLCSIGNPSANGQGGGYYTYGDLNGKNGWFGLGGLWCGGKFNSMAGSGGIAGVGGNVIVSSNAKIFAYNGDRVTNGDYNTKYYQYNKNGELTSIEAIVMSKPNNKKFIPALIFIQDGIKRAVYNYPIHMSNGWILKFGIERNTDYNKVLILAEDTGIEHFSQGIGSGAGYIELSNGTYTIDESMN